MGGTRKCTLSHSYPKLACGTQIILTRPSKMSINIYFWDSWISMCNGNWLSFCMWSLCLQLCLLAQYKGVAKCLHTTFSRQQFTNKEFLSFLQCVYSMQKSKVKVCFKMMKTNMSSHNIQCQPKRQNTLWNDEKQTWPVMIFNVIQEEKVLFEIKTNIASHGIHQCYPRMQYTRCQLTKKSRKNTFILARRQLKQWWQNALKRLFKQCSRKMKSTRNSELTVTKQNVKLIMEILYGTSYW